MGTCFVIQPFDEGVFDKRYEDTFEPAINSAGLEPYRVDRDPRAEIPIIEIENGIRKADVCFAEISTDNPNVWYELGFAFAARKPVVMVCTEERSRFPFDVQHRAIVRYKTEAASDFERLKGEVSKRLTAALERQRDVEEISTRSVVSDSEGLTPHEIVGLVSVASYPPTPVDPPSYWMIRQDMGRAGYTDIAVTLAVRGLLKKGLIQEVEGYDHREGDKYEALIVSDSGLVWLESNQEKLVLKKKLSDPDDDLPF